MLTDAFNAMLQRLAVAQRKIVTHSRLALLGEVAASIVHDVRTPLSVLKTSAQLLGSAELSAAEQRELAGMIASEVDRLNRVVTNLADLGRRPPAVRTRQTLHALVERTLAVLRPSARAREITLELRGDAELRVDADADQLLQALLNVVHNAAQAAPAGGRVRIEWRVFVNASNGIVEAKMFHGNDTSPMETITRSSQNTGSATTGVFLGQGAAQARAEPLPRRADALNIPHRSLE